MQIVSFWRELIGIYDVISILEVLWVLVYLYFPSLRVQRIFKSSVIQSVSQHQWVLKNTDTTKKKAVLSFNLIPLGDEGFFDFPMELQLSEMVISYVTQAQSVGDNVDFAAGI